MRKLFWLLPLLAGCGHNAAEHPTTKLPAPPQAKVQAPTAPAKPDSAYTCGDRATAGPLDTLHVGRDLVLRLVPGSAKDFAKASRMTAYDEEAAYLKRENPALVRRDKHTLYLTLVNGKQLRLTDSTYDMRNDQNEEIDKRYTFLGSLAQIPYWQVDSLVYEGNTTLLINKLDGSISRLWNYPIVSPDTKHIIIQSQGIETAMAPNGLQLFDISTQGIILHWERLLQYWEPYRVHWLNDKTLAIEQRRFPATATGEEKLTYVRLLLH